MRDAAIIATWIALGLCALVAIANLVILEWERSTMGRHTMAGVVIVGTLVALILARLTGHTPPDELIFVVMVLFSLLAAWRLVLILRRPR